MELIIVFDDLSVKKTKKVSEEEIPGALDSGFMNAFLRVNENNEVEYAEVDFENDTVMWKKPEDMDQS